MKYEITTSNINDKQIISFLNILDLSHADNGTYLCHGENDYGIDVAILENLVLDKPNVKIDLVKPVARDKIYFNWTVTDWNSPVTDYYLSVSCLGSIKRQSIFDVCSFSERNVKRYLDLATVNSFGFSNTFFVILPQWLLKKKTPQADFIGHEGMTI